MTTPVPGSSSPAAVLSSIPVSSCGSRFWKWLNDVDPCTSPLAWCHSTDAFAFRAIMEQGRFTPTLCPVFKESLLYFFYGRPAYKKNEVESIGGSARSPVIFVFNPTLVRSGLRVHPFDTGAFEGGRYKKWMHPAMRLEDFEMPCEEHAPLRHVNSFYKSADDYLNINPSKPLKKYSGELEVNSLVALLLDTSAEDADDRKLALELQIKEEISLDPHVLMAVVFPDEMQDAKYVKSFFEGVGKGVEKITYKCSPYKRSIEYQGLIEERVIDFQNSKKASV
jgi:hypothetical protein